LSPTRPDKYGKGKDGKKSGKIYKTRRVSVIVEDKDSFITLPITNMLPFDNLLSAGGVNDYADKVEFYTINHKADARLNHLTGVSGFIPNVKDKLCFGLETEGGGIAQQIQEGGVFVKSLGHLDLDANHKEHQEVMGEVVDDCWGGISSLGLGNDLNRMFKNDTGSSVTDTQPIHTNTTLYKHNEEQIVRILVKDKVISMLVDSGTQVSVLKTELLPEDCGISNDTTNQIKLLSAFGDPVPATIVQIEAMLIDGDDDSARNYSVVSVKIAVCNSHNGDTGLLSITDYNILKTSDSFIPGVKIISNSGRLCLDCMKVDIADLVDNNIVSDNNLLNVSLGGKFD
jgi:hypothetical protein